MTTVPSGTRDAIRLAGANTGSCPFLSKMTNSWARLGGNVIGTPPGVGFAGGPLAVWDSAHPVEPTGWWTGLRCGPGPIASPMHGVLARTAHGKHQPRPRCLRLGGTGPCLPDFVHPTRAGAFAQSSRRGEYCASNRRWSRAYRWGIVGSSLRQKSSKSTETREYDAINRR